MQNDKTQVITLRPDGRKGVALSKVHYTQISSFILSTLSTAHEYVTLNYLLEEAQRKISNAIDYDLPWYVFQIKLDLEARDLIKVISTSYSKRYMYIKLTRKGAKQVRNKETSRLSYNNKQIIL